MKPSLSLNKIVLLVTTMMFAPSVALAQTEQPSAPPVSTDQTDQFSDEFGGEEIVVRGRFIPQPMRETSEVVTILSAEDLARQGDDNAAEALTRLSGLSVASGGFVYVRGLGDRYSFALLNGSPLPSPEPLRRQVPLDLFPSNILDGANVQKTFSPNYPGEFGGGIIDLRTVRIPTEAFMTIKVGTGGNTEAWGGRGLTYYGERSDWTGIADATRDIPGALASAIAVGQRIQDSNFAPAELEIIGESLINSPLTVLQREDFEPDFEGEVTAGTAFDLGQFNLGLVGVVGYDSSMRTRRAQRDTVIDSGTLSGYTTRFNSLSTTWDVVLNAFGSASLGWDTHEITLTSLLIRSTSKDAQIDEGFNSNDGGVDLEALTGVKRHTESSAWYERQLASIQLSGEHGFGDLQLDWRTAFAQSTRDAPYERSITYFIPAAPAEPIPSYPGSGNNSTRFSYLTDEVASAGVDVSYTLPLSNQRDVIFSGGLDYSNSIRWYDLLSFAFVGSAPADVSQARPDFLFSPDNIDPLRFEIAEFTGRDDAYKGRMTIQAAYAAADVELLPLLRVAVGARFESSTQIVRTGNRFGETPSTPVTIEEEYWLPAATMTWNFAEDLQLRLGYSQTIARPQFRELALTPYLDPETDRIYQGNPGLVNSEFKNYDARLEYYLGANQFVTFGGFYKQISDPIEEVIVLGSDGTTTLTRFINAPEATLYGAEIEYRTNFSMPFEVPFLPGADWLFAANYTYTSSEVTADEGDTVINPTNGLPVPASNFGLDGSPLQGTPENIANLQFGFETEATQLTMLVNWVDERILRRGLGQLPAVLEDPGIGVDLVFRHDIEVGGSVVTFGLSGRNLLDEAHEEYQNSSSLGRTNINTYERGRSVSMSLTAKY